tara:strand:- start:34 stop:417 length:384 start_codon:yes stop_codon:yes gene_type:complete
MNIKKSVVGLMFSMLLVSEMAAADWGDVYYCQMTNNLTILPEGKKENYTPEKLQFKLDQTKNAMVFGSTGYFANIVIELFTGRNWPSQEKWYANNKYSMTFFNEGKFFYTSNGSIGATVISADCEIF